MKSSTKHEEYVLINDITKGYNEMMNTFNNTNDTR